MMDETLAWQKIVFAERPNRFDLLKITLGGAKKNIKIRILRNHAFEQVANVLEKFLAYSGMSAEFEISNYDNSLLFLQSDAQVEIVWLDYSHYTSMLAGELNAWLVERLTTLRSMSKARIIVANVPENSSYSKLVNEKIDEWCQITPGTGVLDLAGFSMVLGPAMFDASRMDVTGSKLSNIACLFIARALGLGILPDLFLPRLKAIAIDLDNTLYTGVLAEDGINGVVLKEHHLELQRLLKELSERGILLTVVSRNEFEDVERLFQERDDFILKPDHISKWKVSWGRKADAIRDAAEDFRISTDSFLFIDDNLGEIIDVISILPDIKSIYSGYSPKETVNALRNFPSLWPKKISETDTLRSSDLKANLERENIAVTHKSTAGYIKELGVNLTFSFDSREDIGRLSEISAKTNQFNLNLTRLTEVDIFNYFDDPERSVIHFKMADRLSDSGSVGVLYARREDGILHIDELCISCRAMGRKLEDIMITEAIRGVQEILPAKTVRFAYVTGPRNKPARDWLERYAGTSVPDPFGTLDLPWTGEYVTRYVSAFPINISWKE